MCEVITSQNAASLRFNKYIPGFGLILPRDLNSVAADPHRHQWLQVVFQILLLAA